MRIVKITDYGNRTVVIGIENPDDPEWVHHVGAPFRGAEGRVVLNATGSPVLITNSLVPNGESGLTCHNCHSNWRYREYIFDGDSRFMIGPNGERVSRTDTDYVDDIRVRYTQSQTSSPHISAMRVDI
jgi:hypothetical protein